MRLPTKKKYTARPLLAYPQTMVSSLVTLPAGPSSVRLCARNAFCTRSKKYEVSTNDTHAAGARDSNHADRWLESMWITICPATYLITPIITPGDDLQFQGNTSPFSSGHQSISPATGPWKSPSRTPRGRDGAPPSRRLHEVFSCHATKVHPRQVESGL